MHRVQMFHVTTKHAAEPSLFSRRILQLPVHRVTPKRQIKHSRILQHGSDNSQELRINPMSLKNMVRAICAGKGVCGEMMRRIEIAGTEFRS
jgi:hypothetical protein